MPDSHLNWDILLRAWLHDPVDKPADIRGHESRAERYASVVLNEAISISELKFRDADPAASAAERLPMPPVNGDYENLAVSPEADQTLTVIHPFSGATRKIAAGLDSEAVEKALARLAPRHGGRKIDFLSLWRYAPETLSKETGLDFEDFPAETRNPDHTLWHHLDTTAAFALASHSGASRAALLSFKLAPVQPFIEASRSIRDLLTGSWLLSFLTFAAIEPVLEECGPTAFVYPSLRGLPLMDWWLRKQGVPNVKLDPRELARPSIPHRFLAIVPSARAKILSLTCVEAARRRWKEVAERVRAHLDGQMRETSKGWDRLWEAQIDSYFDFRTCSVDYNLTEQVQREFLGEAPLEMGKRIGQLGWTGGVLPGHWQRVTKISAALMESDAAIRHIPAYRAGQGDVPQKCTLLGSYEQMGPARLAESTAFWARFHNLNSAGGEDDAGGEARTNRVFNDRLCAIALTKRLAAFKYAVPELGIPASAFNIPDTRRLAALAGEDFVYYAILAFDGDHMGRWLSGENSLEIGQVLHPKIAEYHKAQKRGEILRLKRPVSPALHASFSERLTRFATKHVPGIVEAHRGTLIYSGGDDVLAALPLTAAVACAREIREAFSRDEVLGPRASGSAGIAIAHYKEDLRLVLESARKAEKTAKDRGRDRIAIAALRRSGGHTTGVCAWSYASTIQRQFDLFNPQGEHRVSDRWTYTLRGELPSLGGLPREAFEVEMRRVLRHSEGAKKHADEFLRQYKESGLTPEEFLDLTQTASFMTRGKDG